MRAANKAILRTRHVTPTLDELITRFNGATIFSKIDLRSGYHQLVLHPSSRYITTFSTHAGLYQYKRLSFWINAAAEVFQHEIQTVIEGVPGVINISDDIAVFGVDQASHAKALKSVLERLHNAGLTANLEKCEFGKEKIEFFGLVFSGEGVSPDPKKVADLHAAKEPQNPSEVRSFLGLAQYSARFIKNFATITEPLRHLTKQTSEWRWGEKEARSFQEVKVSLEESATNAYFDMQKEIEIVVDASPVGLAALLVQEERVVIYASRALRCVEARYSQTEREALAVVWACEHFNRFIKGAPRFTVISDHKPLESIWQKTRPPLRIERWGLRLQQYDMIIKYCPGARNPADYMSRHPARPNMKQSREQQMAEHYVNALASVATPVALSVDEVKRETAKDVTLQAVIRLVQTNQWHDMARYHGPGVNYECLCSYNKVRNALTVNESADLLMRDYQIVVPSTLQKRVVKLAHEGHQGSKTKALLRSKVWFPGVDAAVEEAVRSCIPCQANSTRRDTQPLAMSTLPRGPWLEISIDFCGPLPTGEYLMVMVDAFSRFPVVEVVRSTSAETVIPVVDDVFSLLGYPDVVKSDNGPPFSGHAWQSYLQENSVRHRKITPLWPQANAQAEAFNKPLMKALKSANISGRAWKKEMRQFLRAYRCTPYVTTEFTPHRLLFARDPRTKLPEFKQHRSIDEKVVRRNDAAAKLRMKTRADKKLQVRPSTIGKGDLVLVRQRRLNKLSTPFDPRPLLVTERKGTMVTAQRSGGSKVTRNASMFRQLPYASEGDLPPVEDDTDDEMEMAAPDTAHPDPTNEEQLQQLPVVTRGPRRPSRVSQRPERLVEQM